MPIRLRLALLYTSVMVICLVGFVIWFHGSTSRHLIADTDETLVSWASLTARRMEISPSYGHPKVMPEADVYHLPGIHIQILDTKGHVLYCSESLVGQQLPKSSNAIDKAVKGKPSFFTAKQGDARVRVFNYPVKNKGGKVTKIVQAGRSLYHIDSTVGMMKHLALPGTLITIVILGLLSYGATLRALEPVAHMTDTARAISLSGEFGRRVDVREGNDELSRLGKAFNEMLSSLDDIHTSHKRFLADVSHELRSPLTSLSNNVNYLGREGITEVSRREVLTDMDADVERMRRLISQLLFMARTDGQVTPSFRDVDLSQLVQEEFQSFKSMAGDRELVSRVTEGIAVLGDRDLLRQAIRALVENAIRYTLPQGLIEVVLTYHRDGHARLIVEDNGFGIAEDEREAIFNRFFRSAKARVVDPDGSGLGLSLVKRVVDIHGADIKVESFQNKGSRFIVDFKGER